MVKCKEKYEGIQLSINRKRSRHKVSETINAYLSSKHYCVKNENEVTFKINFKNHIIHINQPLK